MATNLKRPGDDSINLKSLIYKLLRISNDINAVRRGRVGKRIGRRVTGRGAGKIIRKLFK